MTLLWRWLAFPAIAMSLGWGLRGYIGGGPLGAMIPGAMVGLALCLLLGREGDSALVAAFAAVGVGFGGEMTYGQTVGLSLQPEAYWWAITGFAVKGAAWGLLGGAMIGVALDRSRYRMRDLAGGLVFLVAGTWAGWRVVNEPRLIYFSNRVDRPRPEVWAGLLAGAAALLLWLAWRGGVRLTARFAGWGAIGGGLGFASGAAVQVWGTRVFGVFSLGWWKVMELTFGALLGLALGGCAWRNRGELTRDGEGPQAALPLAGAIAMAAGAIAATLLIDSRLPVRFGYVVAGALLLSLAPLSRTLCWEIAISLTCCAFALDLLKNKPHLPSAAMWVWVAGSTLATVKATAAMPRVRPMFLWITWAAVATSLIKAFAPPASSEPVMMESIFVAMAALVTWLAPRTLSVKPSVECSGTPRASASRRATEAR